MSCIICSKKDTVHCEDCGYEYCEAHDGIHNMIKKSHAISLQTRFN
jgi:hypothetical protein